MGEMITGMSGILLLIIIFLVSYLYKLIKSNNEKKILSNYFHNDRSFNMGYSHTESLIRNNLDKDYYIKREEEKHFKQVYERIILFTINLYLYPDHKIENKYMKSEELYIMYYIYNYFADIVDNKRDYELKYYMKQDEYGGIIYEFNDVGKVAMKVYLASANYLNKQGIIDDYHIENIKSFIRKGGIEYTFVRY